MKKRNADHIFINGVYLMHQDDRASSVEKGKRADLIVLDRNLFDNRFLSDCYDEDVATPDWVPPQWK